MTNAVSLFGEPLPAPEPCPSCIEALETLLELARGGEIVGICATATYRDGSADYRISGFCGSFSQIGALATASLRLQLDQIEG